MVILVKHPNGNLEMVHFDQATVNLVHVVDPSETYAKITKHYLSKAEITKDGVINKLLSWLG